MKMSEPAYTCPKCGSPLDKSKKTPGKYLCRPCRTRFDEATLRSQEPTRLAVPANNRATRVRAIREEARELAGELTAAVKDSPEWAASTADDAAFREAELLQGRARELRARARAIQEERMRRLEERAALEARAGTIDVNQRVIGSVVAGVLGGDEQEINEAGGVYARMQGAQAAGSASHPPADGMPGRDMADDGAGAPGIPMVASPGDAPDVHDGQDARRVRRGWDLPDAPEDGDRAAEAPEYAEYDGAPAGDGGDAMGRAATAVSPARHDAGRRGRVRADSGTRKVVAASAVAAAVLVALVVTVAFASMSGTGGQATPALPSLAPSQPQARQANVDDEQLDAGLSKNEAVKRLEEAHGGHSASENVHDIPDGAELQRRLAEAEQARRDEERKLDELGGAANRNAGGDAPDGRSATSNAPATSNASDAAEARDGGARQGDEVAFRDGGRTYYYDAERDEYYYYVD